MWEAMGRRRRTPTQLLLLAQEPNDRPEVSDLSGLDVKGRELMAHVRTAPVTSALLWAWCVCLHTGPAVEPLVKVEGVEKGDQLHLSSEGKHQLGKEDSQHVFPLMRKSNIQ